MSDEERNHHDNLIYLCGDHHTQIDGQEADFTIESLAELKAEHEGAVQEATLQAFSEVGFPELERARRAVPLIETDGFAADFELTPPQEKIDRNGLSDRSRMTIMMGMGAIPQVRAFVGTEAKLDPNFPDRLRAGFLAEYHRLRQDGHAGDELFEMMCSFVQRGLRTQVERSAGIAVLVYLFEACDVFER